MSEVASDASENNQTASEIDGETKKSSKKVDQIPKKVKISGGLVLDVPPLDDEQAEIVSTPVEEIPEAKIFIPVPLVARLTTGVPNVKKLVLK